MTLDDLAAATGVPSRTIRFYRQCGLIDPPERVGRQAFYNDAHLARVRTIAGLRDQGMGLDAIARLLADPATGRDALAPLLQIGSELQMPWIEDRAAIVSGSEALDIFQRGGPAPPEPELVLTLLEHYGVITGVPGTDPARYSVGSVAALELAGQLFAIGVKPELTYRAWQLMQTRLDELARDLIALFAEHPDASFAEWPDPLGVGDTFTRLQTIALRSVELIFGQQIEDALRQFVERGGVFEADRRSADPTD